MTYWRLSKFPKNQKSLKLLPQETEFSDLDFNTLLDNHLPKLGSQQRTRVMDAAAIAFTTIKPIGQWCKPLYVMMLLNSLTPELALCWVHEGRHYKS